MQKKYFGPKLWPDTLYFCKLDEYDIEYRKEYPDEELFPKNVLKPGDTEFYLPVPPFGDTDKNSIRKFDPFFNGFEDTNLFITDTERFQWYKGHRI